jgi:hypothetical protein
MGEHKVARDQKREAPTTDHRAKRGRYVKYLYKHAEFKDDDTGNPQLDVLDVMHVRNRGGKLVRRNANAGIQATKRKIFGELSRRKARKFIKNIRKAEQTAQG